MQVLLNMLKSHAAAYKAMKQVGVSVLQVHRADCETVMLHVVCVDAAPCFTTCQAVSTWCLPVSGTGWLCSQTPCLLLAVKMRLNLYHGQKA